MSEHSGPVRRQRIAAYARIIRGDALLLTRISDLGHHSGSWTLPGGGIDHGENPRAALVREVYEETGLKADVTRLLDVHDTHFTGAAPSGRVEDYHGIHLVFAAEVRGDAFAQVTERDGTTYAAEWVPLDTIDERHVLEVVRFALALG